jgi:hypothetical protein
MDIYSTRKKQLGILIDSEYDGNQTAFAREAGLNPPQVNRWLSMSTSDGRQINEKSARQIEAKIGKPLGWLDRAELNDVSVRSIGKPDTPVPLSKDERSLLESFCRLSAAEKKIVVRMVRALAIDN